MENYLKTFPKKFMCKNESEAMEVLHHLYGEVADLPYWRNKIQYLTKNVFNPDPTYNVISPDDLIYSGQLFLKLIYASAKLAESIYPPANDTLDWNGLIDSSFFKRAHLNFKVPNLIDKIEHVPNYLSAEEILDPGSFLVKFFSINTLGGWVKRWNKLREYSFYTHSVLDGDEWDFLQDFDYLLKLLEATYLIYVRHYPHQK